MAFGREANAPAVIEVQNSVHAEVVVSRRQWPWYNHGMSRDDFWDDDASEAVAARTAPPPRRNAARQAILVDVFLLMFAWLYAVKVSPRAGLAVLAVVMLIRWRRVLGGLQRVRLVLFGGGATDPQAISNRWETRSTVNGLSLLGVLLASVYGVAILVQLWNPILATSFPRIRLLGSGMLALASLMLIAAWTTWKCPACGRAPARMLKVLKKCERCGASFQQELRRRFPSPDPRAPRFGTEYALPVSYNHGMATVCHTVGELAMAERAAIESLLGYTLRDDQQIYLVAVDATAEPAAAKRREARAELETIIAETQGNIRRVGPMAAEVESKSQAKE